MSDTMPDFDEWIIGEGLEPPGRWYVIHLALPMFVVEVIDDEDPDGPGMPLDCVTWSLPDGQCAANPVFYDEPPTGDDLDALMSQVGVVMADYDVRVDRRNTRLREQLADDLPNGDPP